VPKSLERLLVGTVALKVIGINPFYSTIKALQNIFSGGDKINTPPTGLKNKRNIFD
jgi:hypothetical protein